MTARQANKLADRFPDIFLGRDWPWRKYFASIYRDGVASIEHWRISIETAWSIAQPGDTVAIGTWTENRAFVAIFWL